MEIRAAAAPGGDVLGNVAAGVFDDLLDPRATCEFLNDPRHRDSVARTNRVKELRPLMPKVLDALRSVKAGDVVSVGDSPAERRAP